METIISRKEERDEEINLIGDKDRLEEEIEEYILSEEKENAELKSFKLEESKLLSPSIYRRLIFLFIQCRRADKAEELISELENAHPKTDPQQILSLKITASYLRSLSLEDTLKLIHPNNEKSLYSALMACCQHGNISRHKTFKKASDSRISRFSIHQFLKS
jgi:hypothetical protein